MSLFVFSYENVHTKVLCKGLIISSSEDEARKKILENCPTAIDVDVCPWWGEMFFFREEITVMSIR